LLLLLVYLVVNYRTDLFFFFLTVFRSLFNFPRNSDHDLSVKIDTVVTSKPSESVDRKLINSTGNQNAQFLFYAYHNEGMSIQY
jgi:hypothetical protein